MRAPLHRFQIQSDLRTVRLLHAAGERLDDNGCASACRRELDRTPQAGANRIEVQAGSSVTHPLNALPSSCWEFTSAALLRRVGDLLVFAPKRLEGCNGGVARGERRAPSGGRQKTRSEAPRRKRHAHIQYPGASVPHASRQHRWFKPVHERLQHCNRNQTLERRRTGPRARARERDSEREREPERERELPGKLEGQRGRLA